MKPFKVPGGQGDVQTGCCDTGSSHVSLHWSQQQLSQDVWWHDDLGVGGKGGGKATCTFHNVGAVHNSRNTMYQRASVVLDQQINQVFFKDDSPQLCFR